MKISFFTKASYLFIKTRLKTPSKPKTKKVGKFLQSKIVLIHKLRFMEKSKFMKIIYVPDIKTLYLFIDLLKLHFGL